MNHAEDRMTDNDINKGFIDGVPNSQEDLYEEEEAIMIHQEQSDEEGSINGGGAQFNFASLL